MPQTYLERYFAGEYEQVWRDLVELSAAVRDEPVYSDARAVAHEMMQRAQHNVELLVQRLRQLDYRFAREHDQQYSESLVWEHSSERLRVAVDRCAEEYGLLPLTLRAWFDVVGQVDFTGDHPQLAQYHVQETAPISDPFVVSSFYANDAMVSDIDEDDKEQSVYAIDIAPDADHKSNYSGGAPLRLALSSTCFDSKLLSDNEWDGMYFVPYLRVCCAWGGFPGLKAHPEAAANAKDVLALLTHDLLPL